MSMKKNTEALPMVLSQSIDAIYIGRILFEELVSDTDLFGTVVEGKRAKVEDVDEKKYRSTTYGPITVYRCYIHWENTI